MVSVNEKYFLEKVACDNSVKSPSPQKFGNADVCCSSDSNLNCQTPTNSEDSWDYHVNYDNNCKHEKSQDNCVGSSVTSFPNDYLHCTPPRKRIVWYKQVINNINTVLSQCDQNSSSHSSWPDRKRFYEDVNLQRDYSQPSGNNLYYAYSLCSSRERTLYDRRGVNKKCFYTRNNDREDFKKSKVKNISMQLDANWKYESNHYSEVVSKINQRMIEIKNWVKIHQPKISLIGDSHTRHLADIINEMLPGFKIEATVKPGAKSKYILSNVKNVLYHMSENDFVVTLSGTNDMWSEALEEPKSVIYNLVMEARSTNLLLCNVPNNYLEPVDSFVHENITNFNQFYQDVASFSNRTHLVNLHQLENRSFFTRHGLHFNLSGKIKICDLLANKILDIIDSIKT